MLSPRAVLTSIFILGVASCLVVNGLDLLRFEAVDAATQAILRQEAKDDESRAARRSELERSAPLVSAFTHTLGVEGRARRDLALLNAALDGDATTEADLGALLATTPTSGRLWLDLALARWRRGAPLRETLSALQMSEVAQPHEAETMVERVIFALRIWELLPKDEQRQAITQLVELDGRFEPAALQRLQAVLAKKPAETKAALRDELAARGAAARPFVRTLGLQSP